MRLFVSEFACGGGCRDASLHASLAREGPAMLRAILADCQRIPDLEIVTTWDARCGEFFFDSFERLEVHRVDGPAEETQCFDELVVSSDATWLIAPEFEQILEKRTALVERRGGRLIG